MTKTANKERRVRDNPFLRAITFSYLTATCLLLVFTVASNWVLQNHTKSEATAAAQINISGSQRMQSQKIAMLGNRLVQRSSSPADSGLFESTRQELVAAAEQMEQSHHSLIHGDPAKHLNGPHSEAIRAIYFDGPGSLDDQLKAFVAEAKALAASPKSELNYDNRHLLHINSAAEGSLLASLKAVVRQYQQESETNVAQLQRLQQGVTGMTIAILLLLVLFVFRPMVGRIQAKISDLRDAETLLRHEKNEHQKAEQRFHSVVEASPVAILGTDKDGRIVLCNKQASKVFGYEREELLADMQVEMLIPERFRSRHMEYRDGYASDRSTRAMGAGRDLSCLNKDGHEFPAEIGISTAETSEGIIYMATVIDLSARRKAENALLLQRAYTDSLVETTQAIVLVLELDATIRYFNPYMEQLSGYRLKEVQDKDWLRTFIPEGDRDEIRQLFMQSISDMPETSHTNQIATKDGQKRIIEWHNKTLKNLNGQITGVLATGIDITNRVHDEEILRQSEEKFRLLFESSSDGICVLDMQGNFIDINKIFHELLGYTRKEMMEMSHISAVNTPEAAEAFIRRMTELERFGQARFEAMYKKKLGTVIPVEVNARLISFENSKVILAAIRDITARKHLEMELAKHRHSLEDLVRARTHELSKANKQLEREIAERRQAEDTVREMAMFPEMNPAPVLRMDREGTVEMANQAAQQLCEGEKILGAPIFSLCPELSKNDFDQLFSTDQKLLQFETKQHERNFVFSLLADPDKNHVYAHGADITQIKQLEAQIRQSQKMDAVGQLAGGIAHDFNSLLGVILGFGDMMRDDIPADNPLRENLEEIMIAGNRAKELVNELMDFSRPDRNHRKPMQLDQTVEESARMLRASLPASIVIQSAIQNGKGSVLANASQVRQILMNLGINAGDAIGNQKGEVSIELSGVQVDMPLAKQHKVREGSYLRLTVSDSGCGMNEATMSRIFEPFFTTKAVGKGTGLGLAVVHGIIKGHQGFVTMDSQPGKGSRFHVYLPTLDQQQ